MTTNEKEPFVLKVLRAGGYFSRVKTYFPCGHEEVETHLYDGQDNKLDAVAEDMRKAGEDSGVIECTASRTVILDKWDLVESYKVEESNNDIRA
jgi:hypothetical protein